MPSSLTRLLTPILVLALTPLLSCSYPVRNEAVAEMAVDKGYRWSNLDHNNHPDTLVIVTASGGGTRAAALELSVLEGLQDVRLPSQDTLADEIDVLSSVSGGSVTAAYFALHGAEGFHDLETKFIRRDGIRALLISALNPIGIAEASSPAVERIDFLIDYFEKTLFPRHETYADLLARHRRPYLILNAADMVEGVPFPFTQSNFDLICSDLAKMKLSTAVAASAAFPVALSPVTLKNYSPCAAEEAAPWPPPWVQADADTSWYTYPERADRGRVEESYARGAVSDSAKAYIHLLDGGIADNLGIAEPYRMLTTNSPSPAFLDEIAQGDIKKIVFILINARSFPTSKLDREQATPGVIDMLLGTIDSSIDRATAGITETLRQALTDRFAAEASALRSTHPDMAANLDRAQANTNLIEIDFDAIPDANCRRRFHDIGTSWTNSNQEIDALLLVGRALLVGSPAYSGAMDALGGHYEGRPADLGTACAKLAAQEKDK